MHVITDWQIERRHNFNIKIGHSLCRIGSCDLPESNFNTQISISNNLTQISFIKQSVNPIINIDLIHSQTSSLPIVNDKAVAYCSRQAMVRAASENNITREEKAVESETQSQRKASHLTFSR